MGLDMYLSKKTYVKNWGHMTPDRKHKITVRKGGKIVEEIKPERISEIIETVAQWRKANAIHNWFVINCQDGVDDCNDYYVSNEQLKELLKTIRLIMKGCKLVTGMVVNGYGFKKDEKTGKIVKDYNMENGKKMTNPELAEELLPVLEGCFFGGTGYDQYYYADLKYTKKIIQALLKEGGDGSYYYQSSW